jgi:apolipoprotein N-acyltransferase
VKRLTGIVALLTSAIAFYYGTGLHPHWWMTWIAAAPVLAYAYSASARSSALVAFLAYLVGALNLWGYFRILEIPVPVRCLALVAMALAFTAGVLLSRAFFHRRRYALALVSLPIVYGAFEFAMSWGRNGTALNFSYSQMDCLPLLQLASVAGIWGIGFCVLFFSSALAQLIALRKLDPSIAFTVAALFIAVFAFGTMRLAYTPDGRSITIGLAASDQRPLLANEAKASAIIDSYINAIGQLAKRGAEIVVIPEKSMTASDYRSSDFFYGMRDAAIRSHVIVVAGVDQEGKPLKHNFAFVTSSSIDTLYEKHHMVVGWEDGYDVGTSVVLLPPPNEHIGVQICKDMDFPRLSRTYARSGAQLLLVPAWDFEVDDWLHGRMAVMRGVESGFAIARSAKQGFMTISDDRGRILFESRSDATGTAHVLGNIRLSSTQTFYAHFGDWFAWLNLAALATLLFALSRKSSAPITDSF